MKKWLLIIIPLFIIGCSEKPEPTYTDGVYGVKSQEYYTFINDMKKAQFILDTKQDDKIVTYYIDKDFWLKMPYEKKKDTINVIFTLQRKALTNTDCAIFKDTFSGKKYALVTLSLGDKRVIYNIYK